MRVIIKMPKKKKKSKLLPILGVFAGGTVTAVTIGSAFTGFGLVAGGVLGWAAREPKRTKKDIDKTFSKKHIKQEAKHWKKVVSTSPGKETLPLMGGIGATGAALAAFGAGPLFGGIAVGANLLGFAGFARASKKEQQRLEARAKRRK